VYVLCGILLVILVLLHRQNVVVVGAGRSSRSARFATSSELLYLLNLLYNKPSECCVEYKLIQLYQKSSVWCFAFSHTSTFELIPAVATAQSGALVTIGGDLVVWLGGGGTGRRVIANIETEISGKIFTVPQISNFWGCIAFWN